MLSSSSLNFQCKIIRKFKCASFKYLCSHSECKGSSIRNNKSAVIGYVNFLEKEENRNRFSNANIEELLTRNNSIDGGVFKECIDNYENASSKLREETSRIKLLIQRNLQSAKITSHQSNHEIIGNYAYYLKQIEPCGSTVLCRARVTRSRKSHFGNLCDGKSKVLVNFEDIGISNVSNIRVSDGAIGIIHDPLDNDVKHAKIIVFNGKQTKYNELKDISDFQFLQGTNNSKLTRIYYTIYNEQRRAYKLFGALLNTKSGLITNVRCILAEDDPTKFISLYKTKNGRMLFVALTSHGKTKSVFCIKDWRNPRLYHIPLEFTTRTFVENHGRFIYLVSHDGACTRLYRSPSKILRPCRKRWANMDPLDNTKCANIPDYKTHQMQQVASMNLITTEVDVFRNCFLCYCVKPPSTPYISLFKITKKGLVLQQQKQLAEAGYIEPCNNCNFQSSKAQFLLSVPGSMDMIYNVNLANSIIDDVESNPNIVSHVVNVPSSDGTCKIPISLIAKSNGRATSNKINIFTKEPKKCMVYVYGAYGEILRVNNDIQENLLLDMGYILCFAHIRGGGELGEKWHEHATHLNKHKSFLDTIDVLQFLISRGISKRSMIALYATSAGGLVGGNIYNMRPDLCSCIVLVLPFLDLLDAIQNKREPLMQLEYEEFGHFENDKENFQLLDYIYSNSPCNNTLKGATATPKLLIQCNEGDVRAPFYHVVRFVQSCNNQSGTFINFCKGGHSDGDSLDSKIETCAQRIALVDSILQQQS
ncbi:bifunctional Alpha-Beta hydrolase fold/Peptidase S9A [Babesia duncani]|uniref:Prolyl endopeptidase n=1 Tax=Babesia duncani TaxID=323732 RepID=A0AAD9UQN4_9APIC|nr:bifunctional Alpha-Beta hydrolase fold/Peptidase S9A [Babesia duncani]